MLKINNVKNIYFEKPLKKIICYNRYCGEQSFSDGVSSLENSWFSVLQEHIDTNVFK